MVFLMMMIILFCLFCQFVSLARITLRFTYGLGEADRRLLMKIILQYSFQRSVEQIRGNDEFINQDGDDEEEERQIKSLDEFNKKWFFCSASRN